jgi:hypothetical protein
VTGRRVIQALYACQAPPQAPALAGLPLNPRPDGPQQLRPDLDEWHG